MATVDKHEIIAKVEQMKEYLTIANSVNEDSLFITINEAQRQLSKAEGMYTVLQGFNLLPDWKMYQENIYRIKEKHAYILEQKRRNYRPM